MKLATIKLKLIFCFIIDLKQKNLNSSLFLNNMLKFGQ